MAKNERAKQAKLKRKKAKRQAKAASSGGKKNIRLYDFGGLPVYDCYIPGEEGMSDTGIGQAVFSRPVGQNLAVSVFMIDSKCQGVKDAFFAETSREQYESMKASMMRSQGNKAVDPETFVAFLNSAVSLGKRFGINPHQEFPNAFKICQGFTANDSKFDSYFSTSRPQFFVGPGDTKQRIAYVIEALQRTCGADGYDFFSMAEPDFSDDEFLEYDDELED